MKLAIHHQPGSYSERWIEYCEKKSIDFKIVNCYKNNIIDEIKNCDALLWHHSHYNYKDKLFAKQLLFSCQKMGLLVYPDFNTGWHFDDKLGQKYLFEAHNINIAPTNVFFTKKKALNFINNSATFPIVFKLRSGAASSNVKLIKKVIEAKRIIKKAFSTGFPQYDKWGSLKERYNKYINNQAKVMHVIKGMGRLFIPNEFNKMYPKEKGYVLFQKFIPNEGFDYRIEIFGRYCIAMIRLARKNDFRASGGHENHYDKEYIQKDVIEFAFKVYNKLKVQSCALDIIRDKNTGSLYLIEISYCFALDPDEFEHGYWDCNGIWYDEKFDFRDWIIEDIINNVKKKHAISSETL